MCFKAFCIRYEVIKPLGLLIPSSLQASHDFVTESVTLKHVHAHWSSIYGIFKSSDRSKLHIKTHLDPTILPGRTCFLQSWKITLYWSWHPASQPSLIRSYVRPYSCSLFSLGRTIHPSSSIQQFFSITFLSKDSVLLWICASRPGFSTRSSQASFLPWKTLQLGCKPLELQPGLEQDLTELAAKPKSTQREGSLSPAEHSASSFKTLSERHFIPGFWVSSTRVFVVVVSGRWGGEGEVGSRQLQKRPFFSGGCPQRVQSHLHPPPVCTAACRFTEFPRHDVISKVQVPKATRYKFKGEYWKIWIWNNLTDGGAFFNHPKSKSIIYSHSAIYCSGQAQFISWSTDFKHSISFCPNKARIVDVEILDPVLSQLFPCIQLP